MKNVFYIISILFLVFYSNKMVNAEDISFDECFGTDGVVSNEDFPGDYYSLAVQPDGKIIVVGESGIIRYRNDGQIDTGFGNDGSNDHGGSSLTLQPDGKILVAGTIENDFSIIRYNSNGSLDSSFGNNGIVTTDVSGQDDTAKSISLQSNGKIIVAGTVNQNFAAVRYDVNGTLDASFGSNGKVIIDSDEDDECTSVAIQGDDKIVIGGYTNYGSDYDYLVIRLGPDGAVDSGFGKGGKIISDSGSQDLCYKIIIQPDGKIVAGGHWSIFDRETLILARYHEDGGLDSSFGDNGLVTRNWWSLFHQGGTWRDFVLQPDGKFVIVGDFITHTPNYLIAQTRRFDSDGSSDETDFDWINVRYVNSSFTGVAIQPSGSVVAVAVSDDHYAYTLKLVRYTMEGQILCHSGFASDLEETPMTGDFNGDGLTDIITFTRDNFLAVGDVYVALSDGTQFGDNLKWHDWFAINHDETVVIGDFNGDGVDDIATWLAKTTDQVYVALSTGTAMEPESVWLDNIQSSEGDLLYPGDVNGDGLADLIFFARTRAKVFVALSSGNNFEAPELWHDWFAVSTYERPRVGDLNGDGYDDIITFCTDSPTAQGDVYVAMSTGSHFGDNQKWHDWFSVEPTQIIRIGDYNGDGKDDFFTFMPPPSGQVYVVLSQATYMSENELWYEDVCYDNTDMPYVGDVDGDSKADIVVFSQDKGTVKVSLAP